MVITIDLNKAEHASSSGEIEEQIGMIDKSLGLLLVIIASVLLSFYSVTIQRKQLTLFANGLERQAQCLPPVYPFKTVASAAVVGALGFFFQMAQQTACAAGRGTDEAAKQSSRMNLWASLLVLAAALIRLIDLTWTRRQDGGAALIEESTQPE